MNFHSLLWSYQTAGTEEVRTVPVTELESQSSEELSDSELVRRITGGKKQEFRLLVERYQTQLFSMIMRQVRERDIAEELLQETLLRSYRSLHSFRGDSKLNTWMIRIALNVTNSYFASRRFKEKQKTEFAEHKTMDRFSSAFSSTEEKLVRRVESILGKLKPKMREVVVLIGFEGKSYEEAAAVLEIPVGTVRSRLYNARAEMRKLLFEG